MAKGAIAKQEVVAKIQQAFGSDFIGEIDKKIYVWAHENGERVQIAIAMTCPKVVVECGPGGPVLAPVEADGGFDWDAPVETASAPAVEVTVDEQSTIAKLMEELGL